MKWVLFIFLFVWIPLASSSQGLGPERVSKIKSATVRVMAEGGIPLGTGFFIHENGIILSCWHVVLPAMQYKIRLYIELNNGDTTRVEIPNLLKFDSLSQRIAVAYDYAILVPFIPLKKKVPFLKLGDYEKIMEGDEIYTCGYPLGSPQQFISKGIVSTKYENKFNGVNTLAKFYSFPRKEALLDITLNRGNSGGAIVKVGKSVEEDEVIGLADFIINPMGNRADSIIRITEKAPFSSVRVLDSLGKSIYEANPNDITIIFAEALGNMSIGISGCVAINYVYAYLKR